MKNVPRGFNGTVDSDSAQRPGRTLLSRIRADSRFDASPQQGGLKLSGPPSGQSASGGARTRDRRVPADHRADSLATVPPAPPYVMGYHALRYGQGTGGRARTCDSRIPIRSQGGYYPLCHQHPLPFPSVWGLGSKKPEVARGRYAAINLYMGWMSFEKKKNGGQKCINIREEVITDRSVPDPKPGLACTGGETPTLLMSSPGDRWLPSLHEGYSESALGFILIITVFEAGAVEQSATKSEVRGSNPSPGQVSFSMLLCVHPALNGFKCNRRHATNERCISFSSANSNVNSCGTVDYWMPFEVL
ncbi:hypothetical protein PoB_007719700 [Plakobranchus ocellatus]|uniref:Uncharacterized protein n=1 Tax=Plakobranchus ocellatus TaxID=259542 RepID=A0AAV4E3A3_9GAST|nr:hypothetical protein PoB_007719700 [Plakobranchus ocellatus]